MRCVDCGTASVSDHMDDLECFNCGSPALTYPAVLEDDEPVVCANCGALVYTFGELKRRTKLVFDTNLESSRVSGC